MKKKENTEQELMNLRSQIEIKSQIKGNHDIDHYYRRLKETNTELQTENSRRIKLIEEEKRNRVWNMHSIINEKNIANYNSHMLKQCLIRSQTIENKQKREQTVEFLRKIVNPNMVKNDNQKEEMEIFIKSLNKKYGLGLDFLTPKNN